jgi:hypothetical protein
LSGFNRQQPTIAKDTKNEKAGPKPAVSDVLSRRKTEQHGEAQ